MAYFAYIAYKDGNKAGGSISMLRKWKNSLAVPTKLGIWCGCDSIRKYRKKEEEEKKNKKWSTNNFFFTSIHSRSIRLINCQPSFSFDPNRDLFNRFTVTAIDWYLQQAVHKIAIKRSSKIDISSKETCISSHHLGHHGFCVWWHALLV